MPVHELSQGADVSTPIDASNLAANVPAARSLIPEVTQPHDDDAAFSSPAALSIPLPSTEPFEP